MFASDRRHLRRIAQYCRIRKLGFENFKTVQQLFELFANIHGTIIRSKQAKRINKTPQTERASRGGCECLGSNASVRDQTADFMQRSRNLHHLRRPIQIGRPNLVCQRGRASKTELFLLGGRLLALQACICSSSKLVLELFDSTSRVDILQLAGVERMAFAANVDPEFLSDTSSLETIAATTAHCGLLVIGMDAVFHDSPIIELNSFFSLPRPPKQREQQRDSSS